MADINRDIRFDLIKFIAIFRVVTIHVTSSGWSDYPVWSFDWTMNMFWASLGRAVPIFLMVTGALMLDPKKEIKISGLYGKNLLKIVVAMLVWAMAYKVFFLVRHSVVTGENLLNAFWDVLLFKQEFHLYYIHIIILVYICLPILRVFTAGATKKQLEYVLAVWFAFGVLAPTAVWFWPFNLLPYGVRQWVPELPYISTGYCLLGYYIKQHATLRRGAYIAMLIAGFCISFGGTWIMNIFRTGFTDVFHAGPALIAAGLFGICLNSRPVTGRFASCVTYVSKASFCIYLVHVFFLHIFEEMPAVWRFLPGVASVPLWTLVIFICSLVVYVILSHIPVVRKWLI